MTTHNTHNRQTSMSPVGFEHTISAGEGLLGPAYKSFTVINYSTFRYSMCYSRVLTAS